MTPEIPNESWTGNGSQPSTATYEVPDESSTGNGSHSSIATYEVPNDSLSENGSHSSIATDKIPNDNLSGNDLQSPPKARSVRGIVSGFLGLFLLAVLGLAGWHILNQPKKETAKSRRGQQVVPVSVAKVTQKTVPVQLQTIGVVKAESTVSVTPQVGGQITGIYFQKGQDVKKGQLLFTLDERTQIAAIQQAQGTVARDMAQVQQARATLNKDLTVVRQAQANLAKDEAQAKFAQAQAGRYQNLYNQGAISQDQAQQYSTNALTSTATLQADREAIANAQAAAKVDQAAIQNAEAVVKADQAALENTRVQLSYTKIYAPIDGRAGDILVNQGNVVQPNNTNPLLTIYQIRPIQVSFSVPEKNLSDIQKYAKDNKLTVDITFPNTNTSPIRGVLTFVNNAVDNTTGTIELMGTFDNAQEKLLPGQYVNATLTLTTQPNAIVVPAQAVQNGPNGQFVFVVKPDNTVENVPVTVSSMVNGLDVVPKGLQPGDTVVTDGQTNLVSGSKIQIKSPSDSAAPAGNQPRRRRNSSS
jgi:multidrug efflux system membrane fusion protein